MQKLLFPVKQAFLSMQRHIFIWMSVWNLFFISHGMTAVYAGSRKNRGEKIIKVLDGAIDGICMILQGAGILILVYSMGQFFMAFKDDNAESKASATSRMAVAAVLTVLPGIIKGLDLMSYFKK